MALAQEHAQAGEERGRWEKELAGSEVEAQVLQMDIDAHTRRLQLTSASSAAMRQLRQKLSEEDRLARQGLAADAQHILNLPDVFFNGHVHAMKAEIQALMHRLSEAQELKAEQDIIQERLAASIALLHSSAFMQALPREQHASPFAKRDWTPGAQRVSDCNILSWSFWSVSKKCPLL